MLQRDSSSRVTCLRYLASASIPAMELFYLSLPRDGERLFILPLKPVQLGKE